MANPNNVPLRKFKKFLTKDEGCKLIRTEGGNEIYARSDLNRPFPIQSHVDPIPQFIIDNARRWLLYNSPEEKKLFYEKMARL